VDNHGIQKWRQQLSNSKTLTQVIDSHLNRFKTNLFTSIPARVESYDASKQTASVKPLISLPLNDGQYVELPVLEDVPVVMPSAGGGILSFPVTEGDILELKFCMVSLEAWKASNGQSVVEPNNRRYHSLPDAIATIGLYTASSNLSPSSSDVELKFAGASIKISPDGSVSISSPSKVSIEAPNVDIKANVAITGASLTHNNVNVGSTHVHGGVTSGVSSTSVPI
jgi:hypothetical protein